MNIDNIKAFLEVATTGSFQQAAKNLHITQSAMSARIKGLEDRLNRQLFIRNRNGAVLTSGGKTFMNHAISMMRTWERARQEVTLADQHEQIVGLGVQINHWSEIALPWVNWMEHNAPNVATQLRADYSAPLMSRLRDGTIDIAVVYEPQARSDIIIENYIEESLIMVSDTPREASRNYVDGYIYVDWGVAVRNQHNHLYPDSPFHRMEFGIASTAFTHVLKNGGSGYFLEHMVTPYIKRGRLHPVANAKKMVLRTYLMYPSDRREQEEIALALEGLRSLIPKSQRKNEK